ncbi:MAG: hypothetical protein ABI972_18980 [Acidobacteriota bacterium]
MSDLSRRQWLALSAAAPFAPDSSHAVMRIPFLAPGNPPLEASQIKIGIDGKPAHVLGLLAPSSDLFLLLALDFSGDLSLVDPARQAILKRIAELPANCRVALLRSQDGLRVAVDPAAPREELTAAVESLTLAARPELLNSLESVQDLADSIAARARVRVAVLFVSDSNVTNYREDYSNPVVNSSDSGDMSRRFPEGLINEKLRQIKARIRDGESPLYLVHVQYLSDRLNTAYQTGLLDLMRSSGGAAQFCRSLSDIPDAVSRAFDQITGTQYTAEVELPATRGGTFDILVSADGREIHSRPRRQFSAKGR